MANHLFSGRGTPGQWNDPQNWAGGVLPGIADNAIVFGNAAVTMNGTATLGNVMILGNTQATFNGTLTAMGAGNCAGFMVCDDASATFAPGSALNVPLGAFEVGYDDDGSFLAIGTQASPTVIHSANSTIGRTAVATGTVTMNDTTWNNDGVLFLGLAGEASLNVIDGAQVHIGNNMAMAFYATSTSTLTLSSGATMTVGGAATIGGGGPTPGVHGVASVTINSGSELDVKYGVTINAGSSVTMQGGTFSAADVNASMNILQGATVSGYGTLASPRINGLLQDQGHVESHGGTLVIAGAVNGTGTMQIDSGSAISLTGSMVLLPTISFQGTAATLELSHGMNVASQIVGFAVGDQIEMAGIDGANWSAATNALKLTEGGKVVDTLHLQGSYSTDTFTVAQQSGLGVITFHS